MKQLTPNNLVSTLKRYYDLLLATLIGFILPFIGNHGWNIRGSAWIGGTRRLPQVTDLWMFYQDGDRILSGNYHKAYQSLVEQTGPLQLIADRVIVEIAHYLGWYIVMGLIMSSYLIAIAIFTRKISSKSKPKVSAIAVLISGTLGLPYLVFWWGHWWQIPVAIFWFISIMQVSKNRFFTAGIMIAVTILLEPWGVIAVIPILFLMHKGIKNKIIFVVASSIGIIGWMPFYLTKSFAIGKILWSVEKSSIWGLANLISIDWFVRLIQGSILMILMIIVVRIVKKQGYSIQWIASIIILSLFSLRVGLDSISFPYYWQVMAFIMISATSVAILEKKQFRISLLLFTVFNIPFWVPWFKQVNNKVEPLAFLFALTLVPLLILTFSRSNNQKVDTPKSPIL